MISRGFISASLILCAFSASALDSINVMTLNQYLGADFAPVLPAPDSEKFIAVDRDVIPARSEIAAQPVAMPECLKSSVDGCNYQIVAEAQTPAGSRAVEREFVAVDATVAGKRYRVYNTHLEVKGEEVNGPLFTYYQASKDLSSLLTDNFQIIGYARLPKFDVRSVYFIPPRVRQRRG